MPLKAPAASAEPVPYWWLHGTIEAGGRDFLNDPQRNGSAYLNQNSLAKYYEYSTVKPGPFSNIWLSAGSKDGLHQIDFGGQNICYSDQSYYLDMSKAGEQYLSLGWDQSPHIYSTSAQTPYLGVGTNLLTLPVGLGAANVKNGNASAITPDLQQTDIGIQRNTASAQYRWTPNDSWDIKADLSDMRRSGTQVGGVVGVGTSSFPYGPTQVPRPVDDTTVNYGLNGEYVGTSFWGQRYTFKLGYKGSEYNDDLSSSQVQNPFCSGSTGASCLNTNLSPFAQISLPPSNQMNALNGTLAADLPWKSRYAGTISYTVMTQNAPFIPMTNNPSAPTTPAAIAATTLPASSLNGDINTLLSNNVVTTQITPDLRSKLSYRYYDFQNDTPQLFFPSWVSYDQNPNTATLENAVQSLSMAYVKQNAGEELTWRPTHEWNLGVAYGYERYDWTQADADVTNENSGRVFADWKPWNWLTVRSSGSYASRRYENYNYDQFVAATQFPQGLPTSSTAFMYSSAYQQLMFDNRDRWKADLAVDLVAVRGVTITPTFKYQDDNYGLNPSTNWGLADSRSWSGGVDVTYVMNPDTSITVGYLREYYNQFLLGTTSGGHGANLVVPGPGIVSANTSDVTTVDTFTATVRYAAIPDKLETELRYTASRGDDSQQLNLGSGAAPTGGQFPDDTTWFQRLDAIATYTFDPSLVSQLGWKGVVKAKLRYTWEHNYVSNWQNDSLAPYSPIVSTQAIWLAYDNPNFDVQVLAASVAWTW